MKHQTKQLPDPPEARLYQEVRLVAEEAGLEISGFRWADEQHTKLELMGPGRLVPLDIKRTWRGKHQYGSRGDGKFVPWNRLQLLKYFQDMLNQIRGS